MNEPPDGDELPAGDEQPAGNEQGDIYLDHDGELDVQSPSLILSFRLLLPHHQRLQNRRDDYLSLPDQQWARSEMHWPAAC